MILTDEEISVLFGSHKTAQREIKFARATEAAILARIGDPVAWVVTTEMQDGRKESYPLSGSYKDAKCACDFGDPIPLYRIPEVE